MKHLLFILFLIILNFNSKAQINEFISQKQDALKHTCGNYNLSEEPIWVDSPEKNGLQNKSILSNVTAYTQSIHNAIAKWDAGTCQSFSFGTTPSGNNIRWGQALNSTAKHTGGHSYEDLKISAAGLGTTFNIGDTFYLSLIAGGVLDTAFQLQFTWENLGIATNVVTINIETNYGNGGAPPYTVVEAAKLMDFYNLVNPIVKEVYGAPSRNHTVNVVNDANAVGVNTYYNGPNQVSSSSSNYLDVDNDLDQPRLMIHELVHAYRDNVGISSNSNWHYDPVLSGFEEGMAEGVALIVMDIFIDRYPNFFNGDRHKIHWNQARGMPFEWNYDFQNHTQVTTQDYWSSSQATGSHWVRYGLGASAMKKMYYEDSLIFLNFNTEYYGRMNANHALLPTRNLVVDIFKVIKPQVERTPIEDWINDQRIFDCTINLGKKVFMLSFTSLSWASFQQDNRIFFMETHQFGSEWNWGSTDALGASEVITGANWGWTHQLNNTPGDIDFIKDWNNTSFRNRAIINDGHWVTDAGGPYSGQTLLGPYQGPNPYYVGAIFTRDHLQNNCSAVPGCGKRAYAIGSQNLYTSTSTVASMWPTLVSQGGTVLDIRSENSMNESGLFRFKIGFNDVLGPRVEDSYYRLLGDSFIDPVGVFGGIYSNLANQISGRIFIEHEDFGEELNMTIFNNAFKATRTWASILEPLVKFQGGRNDREYSIPGQIHAVYLDGTCAKKKIDFRTIGYGDGLEGVEMLLFNLEEMDDIIFTESNDTTINVGDNFNLAVTNNFADIFSGDTRINYTWVDPYNNQISSDTAFTFNNAAITDTGIYNIQIDFLGCPVFSLPVRVSLSITTDIIETELQNNLEFNVFPNPANESFTVELFNSKDVHFIITDNLGQEIRLENYIEFNKVVFDSSKLSKGIYFIQVVSKEYLHTEKIIIE